MKKYLIALSLFGLLVSSVVWAIHPPAYVGQVGWVSSGGGISYILEETFETDEYDNVACGVAPCVTEIGFPDGEQATAGLDMIGAKCLMLDHTEGLQLIHSAQDKTWVYYLAKFRYEDTNENSEGILTIRNADGDKSGLVFLWDDQTFKILANGGGASGAAATGCVADTSIWLRLKAKEGTANDTEVCVSTWNGAAWDAYVCSANGTEYFDIIGLRVENLQDEAVEDQYWDNMKASLTEFTNDPTTY